ncbi:MAG: hypothetical protein ISS26_06855 [Candidatus Omnitrophica bacterium]|nr:hypothetical protein [Candidatus Omnitrophota bacterium]
MSRIRFVVLILAVIMVVSLAAGAAIAEEKKSSPFKEAVLKMMGMAGKTVAKEVNAVGRGIKGTTDVVVEEVKDVGALATGDGSKVKEILVEPVTGAAEVVGETAHDVINAPIEAGQETFGEEEVK